MSDFTETVLLRRKLLWERGYRPVPVDRDGNPLGTAWRQEALHDPPLATVTPVDPNAFFTGLLLGAGGEAETLIAVVLDPEKTESLQGVPGDGLETLWAAVIAALDERIGRTPLRRLRGGDPGPGSGASLALLYRSRRSKASDPGSGSGAGIQTSGVFIADGEADIWPDRRPEDVAFADLPQLDDKAWVEALAAGAARGDEDRRFDDGIVIEEVSDDVPSAEDKPREPRGFGPRREDPPGPPDEPPLLDPPEGPRPRPVITVKAGKRHIAADKGLAALYDAGAPFYHRAGELVRIERFPAKDGAGGLVWIPAIRAVPLPALGRALGQVAIWRRLNENGVPYRVDPPNPVVEMIASMGDRWPFRPIAGIVRTPTLRPDLSLLDKPATTRRRHSLPPSMGG